MGLINLLDSEEHRNNLAHFSAIVNIAKVNGEVNEKETHIIERFARKLEIREEEFEDVMRNSNKYTITPIISLEERDEHIYDLLKTINSDGVIDDSERNLILKYATLLGAPTGSVKDLIDKSIKIFNGNVSFEEYIEILKIIE